MENDKTNGVQDIREAVSDYFQAIKKSGKEKYSDDQVET